MIRLRLRMASCLWSGIRCPSKAVTYVAGGLRASMSQTGQSNLMNWHNSFKRNHSPPAHQNPYYKILPSYLFVMLLISYLEGGTSHHIPLLTSGNKAPHTHEARSEVPCATRSRFSACGRTIFWRMLSFNNRNRPEAAQISLMFCKCLQNTRVCEPLDIKSSKNFKDI